MVENNRSIAIVVLAAGESRRFGSPKQLADWFGVPMLGSVINNLRKITEPCYVMLGAHQQDVMRQVEFGACELRSVDSWQEGMNASISLIAAELAALNCAASEQGRVQAFDGVLFLLGDQPLISTDDILTLLNYARRSQDKIVCADYSRLNSGVSSDVTSKPGVPAYFPASLFDSLAALSEKGGEKGAKRVIENNEHVCIKLDARVKDVDTPDDLHHLQQCFLQQDR